MTWRLAPWALVCIGSSLVAWCSFADGPTFDEVAHLVAGNSHWTRGEFGLYPVNPPLVRSVAAIPSLWGPEPSWRYYSAEPGIRSEFWIGKEYFEEHGWDAIRVLCMCRLASLPFFLLGCWIVWAYARSLYGTTSAMAALALWCFCPNVIAYAHLITPDVGAASFGLLATYCFARWIRKSSWSTAVVAGVALGCAELTKFTWVILVPLWVALYCVYIVGLRQTVSQWTRQAWQLVTIPMIALAVINLGYGFEGTGTLLGRFEFVSEALSGEPHGEDCKNCALVPGNVFRGTLAEVVPMPVPKAYLVGIDVQKLDFDRELWAYLGGAWQRGGWWYYYLYALAIKVPLGTCGLLGLAVIASFRRNGYSAPWREELLLLAPPVALLVFISSQTGVNHHMRYALPAFPFVFVWASKVFRAWELGHGKTFIAACFLLAWSASSGLSTMPHCLSYFNELVGGPRHGGKHLANSNVDWGQDLLHLKRWLDAHPQARPIHIAYDGIVDPRVVGVEYELPPLDPRCQPQGVESQQFGPTPGWHAVSTNQIRSLEGRYKYFLEFEPVEWIGYSMPVYHLAPAEVNRVRRELGLPEVAAAGASP